MELTSSAGPLRHRSADWWGEDSGSWGSQAFLSLCDFSTWSLRHRNFWTSHMSAQHSQELCPRELAGRKLHLLRCFTRSIPPNSIYSKQVPICVQGEETRIHLLMGEASKMCGRVLESLPSCIYILGYPSLTDTDRHWCKYGCLTLSFYVGVGQLE